MDPVQPTTPGGVPPVTDPAQSSVQTPDPVQTPPVEPVVPAQTPNPVVPPVDGGNGTPPVTQ